MMREQSPLAQIAMLWVGSNSAAGVRHQLGYDVCWRYLFVAR
jgi:hypothetical protein